MLMQKFYIDRSKWRCGDNGRYKHGIGKTELKNTDGYFCCLGMIIEQIDSEIDIFLEAQPRHLLQIIPFLTKCENNVIKNTDFSTSAISINDHYAITNKDREERLYKLGIENGIILEFIEEYDDT